MANIYNYIPNKPLIVFSMFNMSHNNSTLIISKHIKIVKHIKIAMFALLLYKKNKTKRMHCPKYGAVKWSTKYLLYIFHGTMFWFFEDQVMLAITGIDTNTYVVNEAK